MAIYKQGYREYEGKLRGRVSRIWTIFDAEFNHRIRNKWTIALLVMAWVFGVFPTIVSGTFFVYFVTVFIWLLIFTTVVGAPLISQDLQYNAITLYLSRPIKRDDYFLGKFVTLFALIALIALLPTIIMAGIMVSVFYDRPDPGFNVNQFALAFIAIGILSTFVFTNIALAISSTTRNYKYAGGGIFAFLFFSNVLALALSFLNKHIQYLSIWFNLMVIADDWQGLDTMKDFGWATSFTMLVTISMVCMFITWYQIHRAELSR